MEKVKFEVSAKTARLIGRENISDVDGAIIELIKNSYDADADCSVVFFDMPFPNVPRVIPNVIAAEVFHEEDYEILLKYYDRSENEFVKKADIDSDRDKELSDFLFLFNQIIVIDNGEGMTEETLRTTWMNIGTNDKDENRVSSKGRKKTGAKGIGRFALDKLSTKTKVITEAADGDTLSWEIDWNQFENANMLNEISASIDYPENNFKSFVTRIAGESIKTFNNYDWSTGTIIVLNPTREAWSKEYFKKLNNGLRNLFSEANDQDFDIYVNNVYFSEYSFENEKFILDDSLYDYKILGSFDGNDTISVSIKRNEIDTKKRSISDTHADKTYTLQLSDFWSRDRFQKKRYYRADYAKTVEFSFSASSTTRKDYASLSSVGPFSVDLYFVKNANSTSQIVKQINVKKRKSALENYSGVKIYRDGFKVRPYGDTGSGFDWIGLGERVIKSPGGVGTEGAWKVRTNQLLGYIRITKELNPNLTDMANREGLANNEAFHTFVEIIRAMIATFEGDRQIVFREFTSWLKEERDKRSGTNELVENVKKGYEESRRNTSKTNVQKKKEYDEWDNKQYTESEYRDAIIELKTDQDRLDRVMKTMMLYSSAGVMTSTFSHEINRVMSNAGSRMQQLRYTINRLLGSEGYKGNPLFDPYSIIQQSEDVDKILESWLAVIINGAGSKSFDTKVQNVYRKTETIIELWKPLLRQTLIEIELSLSLHNCDESDVNIAFADADMYLIINNFILNSVWFLNKSKDRRCIKIEIEASEKDIYISMRNNGPGLDSMFSNNPDRIFNPGESSKTSENEEGTGLGLWIMRTIVEEMSGGINIIEKDNGFGLGIRLPK